MIITRGVSKHGKNSNRKRRSGFTLAEMMISVVLMAMLLAGITSSFMFIVKSSASVGNYADMNTQSRRCLEILGRDLRMASTILEMTANNVVIEIPYVGRTEVIEYFYSADKKAFIRDDGTNQMTLLGDIEAMEIKYFNMRGQPAQSRVEAKEIQLEAMMVRNVLQIENTNHVISARFMMRNRKVNT